MAASEALRAERAKQRSRDGHNLFTRILEVTEGSAASLTVLLCRQILVGRRMTVVARGSDTNSMPPQILRRVVIGGRGEGGCCSSERVHLLQTLVAVAVKAASVEV
jgi:hypothetical protein